MKCPKCSANMEKIEYQGIEVDRCTQCKGLWFDLREQKELKAMKGSSRIDTGDPAVGRQMNMQGSINCPKDGALMTRMFDLKQPHLWYEACPHCYGVFFDAGEFKDYSHKTLVESIRDLFSRERK